MPQALQRQADAIRSALEPAAARRAPAHLTLFRHLPGLQQADLVRTLGSVTAGPPPGIDVGPPTRWEGRWVAPVRSPALDALRADLADRWHGLLAPGDHAPPRLHISLTSSRAAPPPLAEGPWTSRGLLLWRHEGDSGRCVPERGGAFWRPLVALAFHG